MSNATFNAIVMRYSNRNGEVRFADFVACVIKLKTLFGKWLDPRVLLISLPLSATSETETMLKDVFDFVGRHPDSTKH